MLCVATSAVYSEFCLLFPHYLILLHSEHWYQRWSWEGVCKLGSIWVQEEYKKEIENWHKLKSKSPKHFVKTGQWFFEVAFSKWE